ncbi:hypothetical protein yc1106_03727 [Curvularia clavata]|uniref:Uncharacterized protein n=1 Tax=Curvularia clavata TaxID=95742 RepID=A0A9Q8Z8Y4_CURCL|nr:hypothetical protein yc1106_03727 [Curvularia clavata]
MRSEAVSGQELAEMSHTTGLLRSGYASANPRDDTFGDDSHDTNAVKLEDYPSPSQVKLRYLIRQFRFQFAFSAFSRCTGSRWNADTERRKVAIHNNRAVAAAHGLLHVIPLSGAILLLAFQWTNYWVDEENDYSTELQFVAKLHELFMQASITEILFSLIRAGLINGLVPLCILSGAMQPTQLSYLWTLDVLSLFRSRALQGWRKTIFVVTIPLLMALTALVGPSSAVLMIPRAGVPRTRLGRTYWGVASDQASYPSQIPITNFDFDLQKLNLTLLYSDIYEKKESYGSNIISHPSEDWVLKRLLRWTYKHEPLDSLDETGRTQCWESSVGNSSDWNHSWPWISLIPDLPTLISKVSDTVELSIYDWQLDEEHSTLVSFSPVCISPPEPVDHPLLVVFFRGMTDEIWNQSTLVKPGLLSSMIESQSQSSDGFVTGSDEFVSVTAAVCAISAHWNYGEIQSRYNGVYTLFATGQSSSIQQLAYRKISLDIAGDHPMRSGKFLSTLMGMLRAPHLTNLWLEGVQASALAIWLAKVPTLASVKRPHGLDPYEFFADEPPHKNIEDYTPYKVVFTTYGYGYGMQSTSVYLSMAVLLLYCVITIGYMLYTFATGSASTAWTSGVELLALALQSKRPDHLGHIGVGIDSAKTLGESVGIRVNADNEVELVFAHDRDFNTRGLQKVKQNIEY